MTAATKSASSDFQADLAATSKSQIATVKVLGEGAFGLVDLVLVETATQPLLCVRKKLLNQTDHNNNDPALEVAFLHACEGSPFIVQMWSHVVGVCDYTLLLEYMPYGALDKLLMVVSELRSQCSNACFTWFCDKVLSQERYMGFSEPEARFYIACCVLGLEVMHSKRILHRDLKPSNLLMSEKCYVKLGDLGLCKQLGDDLLAHSQAGTPGYMAPEVLNKDRKTVGYSFPADMWSLGIMTWEFVSGLPPRWAPMSWYWTPTLHFPDHFSPELRSFLTGLLDKSARSRMKLKDCRGHPWFAGLDWDALQAQKLPPPRFPELEMVHIHARLASRNANSG